jgi:hypothetical protein
VGQERGPLSPENRDYGRMGRDTLLSAKDDTKPTSGGRSVGIVHSRTQATEFVLFEV